MLEKIREGSQSLIVKFILGLVILSFALTGVYSYLSGGARNAAAEVNGQTISRYELERAYQNERARMEAQMGDFFKQLMADENYVKQLRRGVLDRLINQQLTDEEVAALGLRVSDEQVKEAIRAIPAFQADGRFDNERYLAVISSQGMSPSRFRDLMRADMSRQQLIDGLLSSAFVLPSEAEAQYVASRQTRDIRYLTVKAADFADQVEVSDEEVKARYDARPEGYMAEEQVALDFIELSGAAIAKTIEVSDDDLQAYYQDNQKQFERAERRRAAHILLTGDDAEGRAKELLARINAGEDFAALAKDHSEDTFSGQNGGDLDWFDKGVMDPAFDEAVFAMTGEGEVVGPVKSSFGYHLIKLTGIEARQVRPFEEVKDSVKAQLVKQQAEERFYEQQEILERTTFENPDSLAIAAQELGVEVKHSPLFSRSQPAAMVRYPKVLDAAFSDMVILDGINSELIEVAPEHVFVVRMADHKPARRKALEEVAAEIKAELMAEKQRQLAEDKAAELLAKLEQGEDASAWLAENGLSFETSEAVGRNNFQLDQALVRGAFELTLASPVEQVTLANGDVAVLELTKVNDYQLQEADKAAVGQLAATLSRSRADGTYQQLLKALKAEAEVLYYEQN
ncbi:SurA N-terminal domain-containing protein [Gallaecimonas sp. GXIMD4217]|uniref:SurA N-terminal domain-containing protein n=1 Tax=Gallaecimonas sp. GXIMD4217 TaxID=3131927 RepID=UPI00311B02C5